MVQNRLPGPIETRMRTRLNEEFSPVFIELENESHSHSVPQNSETHFKLVMVSEKFRGLNRVARSRAVHTLLDHELKNGVHALTLKLLAPDEWSADSTMGFESPPCHGGSKADKGDRNG